MGGGHGRGLDVRSTDINLEIVDEALITPLFPLIPAFAGMSGILVS
jgi:hypothetical protein